jgi:1-acyl-sn-glycerol-3-phosphate acyltransferase
MDAQFIDRCNRGLFRFLCNGYWRIETIGLDHIPSQGPALLVGAHRGFIPWDAMMALHVVARQTGRVPRFLVHPGLLKFSPIASVMRKLGGVLACGPNAERVLESGDMLGVLPEGVKGAFTPLRNAYRLQNFGRNTFVRLAARYHAPIIPFVTVGSAEVHPIFATINSPRWKRYAKWPCIPISTFPFFPLPLPVKWRMQFLPAISVGEELLDAAASYSSFNAVAAKVKLDMQQAIDGMLEKRRSLFF